MFLNFCGDYKGFSPGVRTVHYSRVIYNLVSCYFPVKGILLNRKYFMEVPYVKVDNISERKPGPELSIQFVIVHPTSKTCLLGLRRQCEVSFEDPLVRCPPFSTFCVM